MIKYLFKHWKKFWSNNQLTVFSEMYVSVTCTLIILQIPNWHHYACFWKKCKAKSPAEIHGFDSLRWDDQQKIKEKLKGMEP